MADKNANSALTALEQEWVREGRVLLLHVSKMALEVVALNRVLPAQGDLRGPHLRIGNMPCRASLEPGEGTPAPEGLTAVTWQVCIWRCDSCSFPCHTRGLSFVHHSSGTGCCSNLDPPPFSSQISGL